MANEYEAVPRRSLLSVWRDHRVAMTIALVTGAAIAGVVAYALTFGFSDDEAPIRVRNGSLEFIVLHPDQQWTPDGNSGHYRNRDGEKHNDSFEVVVVPAGTHTCNLYSRSGADIEFTYSDEKKIRVQSQGRNTRVRPDPGVTLNWNSAAPRTLSYTAGGHLTRIAVDGQTLCTFTQPAQLSSVVILNVP